MKTYKESNGITHFEADELGVPDQTFGHGAIFIDPIHWVRVMAFMKEGTRVGYQKPVTKMNKGSQYIVFDGETGVTGVKKERVEKL